MLLSAAITPTNHHFRIRAEIARLEANKARNKKRASKKNAAAVAGSPDGAMSPDGDTPAASGKQTQPTLRKCANCGQVGHIKTNKKSVKDPKCEHCHLSMLHKVTSSSFFTHTPLDFGT